VRYGLQFLGKPHLALVPGLIVLDRGEMLTGEDAWDFLLRRSNLYPRSDVIGYRSDGVDDMVPVKLLDLVAPVQVLIYTDIEATKPIARAQALITSNPECMPPRLLGCLPLYPSIADWRKVFYRG
jgi:hypothetical protein